MEQIRLGLEVGLDVSWYATPVFTVWQMEQIRKGLQQGYDVSSMQDPDFDWQGWSGWGGDIYTGQNDFSGPTWDHPDYYNEDGWER